MQSAEGIFWPVLFQKGLSLNSGPEAQCLLFYTIRAVNHIYLVSRHLDIEGCVITVRHMSDELAGAAVSYKVDGASAEASAHHT